MSNINLYIVANSFDSKAEEENWNAKADLDKNGKIDFDDFFMFSNEFGNGCSVKPAAKPSLDYLK